jgi:uncharacterized protein YjbJ (UPF0337 family)
MAGRTDEVKGSVKETAGKMFGNEQWQAEGKAEQLKGKSERHAAGMKDTAVGGIKRGAGEMLGNEQMQAEGEAQRLKGKAERAG